MAFTLPKGPRGDSPSDPGRRKKATKKKPKSSVGQAIQDAGTKPAPPARKPKPGARSTGKAIADTGRGTVVSDAPSPVVSGDRPSDRPDANAGRKRAVKRQQARDRAQARRDAEKAQTKAALDTIAASASLKLDKAPTTGTKIRDALIGRDDTVIEKKPGKPYGEFRQRKPSDALNPNVEERKPDKATAAVQSVALKALDETTRPARAVGEALKATVKHPGELGPAVAAGSKALVTNKGDMPGDVVVPKNKKGTGWDAVRLAGNIVGDPTTYLTVGTGTAVKQSAKAAAKKATKRAVKREVVDQVRRSGIETARRKALAEGRRAHPDELARAGERAVKRHADRAGRAAAKKVARKRPQNNQGISVGLRATIPGTSRPVIDVKTSGRASAAVSRAVKAPQAAEKLRGKGSHAVRGLPGTKAVRPAGRTPVSHTKIRQAQRELRAGQDAAKRKGAQVKRAVRKRMGKNTTGAEVFERIESTPQGVSLGADATAEVARLVRRHLGESFDAKKASGLADKPFRPRDIETRVVPRSATADTPAHFDIQARLAGERQWATVTRTPSAAQAKRLRGEVHNTANALVSRGRIPASGDARRYAPHVRQAQTEHVAPVPMAERATRTSAEKAREIRQPLAQVNEEVATAGKVKRRPDDVQNELFTTDVATATGQHVRSAAEKVAESRFWRKVAKTGKPLGQVVREREGVLDLSGLPSKTSMVYEVTPRGLQPLTKGSTGELDPKAVRDALKASGRDGNQFVVLDARDVERIRERVFPKRSGGKGDENLALVDRTTGKWKFLATVPSPSYHLRNLVGDSINAWTGDANARAAIDAARVLRGQTNLERSTAAATASKAGDRTIKLGKRAVKRGGGKAKMTHEELLREMEDLGVIGLGQGGKELDDLIHAGGKEAKSRHFDSGPLGTLSRLNVRREDLPRATSYIAARRRGMSPREAADHVITHHFDYGDLNKADRGLRRVVPFATFWTRNVPLQTTKLFTRPGKFATMAKTLDFASKQAGFDSYDQFVGDLNDWQQDGIPIPVRTPWDGELKTVSIGPPTTDLNFHRWAAMLSGESGVKVAEQMGRDFISRLGPFKLLGELPLNYSTFFRGPIDPGKEGKGSSLEPAPDILGGWDAAPESVREFFGVVKFKGTDGKWKWGWNKRLAYGLRQVNPLLNRAIGISTPGSSERNQTPLDSLASLLGANVSNYKQSVEKARVNKMYDRRDELRGRKRYLEDTGKEKTREYKELRKELAVLEKELRGPSKRRARRRGGQGAFGGSGPSGGGAFGKSGGSSGGAFGASAAVAGGEGHPQQAQAPQRGETQRAQGQNRELVAQAPVVPSGDGDGQYVAQATPTGGSGATVRASSSAGSLGTNERELRSYARRAAERAGIDPDYFEAQIQAESDFNPNAGSPAGAQGIAQIMPATARAWGVDPHDSKAALDAAAEHMAQYLEKYDGNIDKALAAYNAGEGAVAQHGGVPPFAETRNYIAKIKGLAESSKAERPRPQREPQRQATPSEERITTGSKIVPTKATEAVTSAQRQRIATYFLEKDRSPQAIIQLSNDLDTLAQSQDAGVASLARNAQGKTVRKAASATRGGGAASALSYARSKIGQAETQGENRGPYVDSLNKRFGLLGEAWCAMFTSVAVTQGGAPLSARSASVAAIRAKARAGQGYVKGFVNPSQAKPGDLILFGDQHIGLVESVGRNGITMIAGNDSNRVQRRTVGTSGVTIVRPKYGARR